MDKYGFSLSELETISSPLDAVEIDGTPIGDKRCHQVVHLAPAIAIYTDTKCWYSGYGIIHTSKDERRLHEHHRGMMLCYFGLPADVHVAIYLTETLRRALDSEWRTFSMDIKEANAWADFWGDAKEKAPLRMARSSFMQAITMRLSERLTEMKEAQSQSKTNNCREIVLAKERIVQAAFDAAFDATYITSSYSRGPSGIDVDAWEAGNAAGDRVNIHAGALEGNE
jgi:hypothetical protein